MREDGSLTNAEMIGWMVARLTATDKSMISISEIERLAMQIIGRLAEELGEQLEETYRAVRADLYNEDGWERESPELAEETRDAVERWRGKTQYVIPID
jgi:hypothetical protein